MMIEINLLPGASRRSRRRGGAAMLSAVTEGLGDRFKDLYLIGAIVAVLVAAGAVAGMYLHQSQEAEQLDEREQAAARDSARFSAVLIARRSAEAARDSVYQQLAIIKSIDDSRFIWPHILQEVSLALPQYTWLTGVEQTTEVTTSAGDTSSATAKARADSAKKLRGGESPAEIARQRQAHADSLYHGLAAPVGVRIIGQTVDIQALTQFMKNLEASPFLKNVQLTRSDLVLVSNQQVTQFELQAQTELPPPSAVQTIPLSIAVH